MRALATLPNGDLIAAGKFTAIGGSPVNHVARWNGASWSAIGGGTNAWANSLAVMPNGDLIIGGNFTAASGVAANRIARWDGSTWSALSSGIGGSTGSVSTLAVLPSGELAVGGDFTTAGGLVSAFFARYVATCPASAATASTGCPSSGGSNSLTALTLPWTGAATELEGTGLPPLAVVGIVTGFAPTSLSLASVLPQGQPGCDLHVSPDLFDFVGSTNGTARAATAIPSSPALAGAVFYQQMIPFEIDLSLQLVAITATNAIELTIGVF